MAGAAVAWGLLVIYGSLTPFQYRPLEWDEAERILRSIALNPSQSAPRGDWVTNCLLLVPLGFAALGALLLDRDSVLRRAWGTMLVLAGGLLLSVLVEVAQLWFPPRHPAKADVIAQTIGNVAGMGIWILVGQPLVNWTRRYWHGPRGGRTVWLLAVYAGGLLTYSVLPLDLTIRPGDLWDKYKSGQVGLVPFRNWHWDLQHIYAVVRDLAVFIPIGVLAAQASVRFGSRIVRPIGQWLAGLAFVGLLEFLQLFVRSRHSDVTDLIMGGVGVSCGMALAWNWSGKERVRPIIAIAMLKCVCFLACAFLVAAVFLEPFELSLDHEQAWERLSTMMRPPLEALRQGELLGIVSNVLRKLLLFGLLGWLARDAALVARPANRKSTRFIWFGLAAGLLIAAAIELAQAWFPPHVPDFTDIAWGAIGGTLGAYLGRILDMEEQHETTTK